MASRVPDMAIYRQILGELREQILAGEMAPGTVLGSESQLAHRYDVGIGTVRRVMASLRTEGLVVGDQGQVARVAEQPDVVVVEYRAADNPVVRARRATMAERRQLDLPEGVWVIEVTHGGFADLHGADRTEVRIVQG